VGSGARKLIERALVAARVSPSSIEIDRALEIFMRHYADHLLDRTRPFLGVPEMVERLQEGGARLSVLSNKPRGFSCAVLDGLGLLPYFFRVIGGDELATRKPDPEGAQLLIDESRVPAGGTLLVGDSVIDVETARAASIDACGVLWGFGEADELRSARPRFLIEEPAELIGLG
jgi:phosphoglycolate phosphatase